MTWKSLNIADCITLTDIIQSLDEARCRLHEGMRKDRPPAMPAGALFDYCDRLAENDDFWRQKPQHIHYRHSNGQTTKDALRKQMVKILDRHR